jgi:hypothetical protein
MDYDSLTLWRVFAGSRTHVLCFTFGPNIIASLKEEVSQCSRVLKAPKKMKIKKKK